MHSVEDKMAKTQAAARYQWKYSLTPTKQKEYDEYLKKLREEDPNNTWRLNHNKKYHEACKMDSCRCNVILTNS